MNGFALVDTFNDFKKYWRKVAGKSLDEKIELWEREYMSKYPELLELQIRCYSEIGLNWKEIARKMIFNKIEGLYPLMEKAWINAREISSPTYNRFCRFWKREIDVLIVIYVGIGCGAGWATEYKKKPTVLLGLENIAELRWHTKDKLEGLILHELCHIIHVILRGISFKEFETLEEDPLFLLYSEGFAQRCEHLILNKELWRYAQDEKWLEWCIQNENLLAKEFLRKVKNGERANEFFGSWLEIFGKSQTGYYLGYSFIKELEKEHDIREIAKLKLNYIREKACEFLTKKTQKFS